MKRIFILPLCAAIVASVTPALAQVRYLTPNQEQLYIVSPFDESYGTSPSFEIYPRAYGYGPAVRVVERCQYPNGWNSTDFSRDLNGIPNGRDHTCPATIYGGHVRVRY